jgi:beta-N-acetylhexosaminidase
MRTISTFHARSGRRTQLAGTTLVLSAALFCASCSSGSSASTAATSGSAPSPTVITSSAGGPSSPPGSPGATTSTGPDSSVSAGCVRTAFSQLTAAQKAGQLVMSGTPVTNPGGLRTRVRSEHLGGVFLAGRTSHSAATIRHGIAELPAQKTAAATIAPVVAIDQEGGKVQSLRGGGWSVIPAATVQASWSQARLAARTRIWVKELKSAGVTMDLAPVADTVPAGTESKNPPIGVFDRQYGSNPASVATRIATVTSSMTAAGVIATVKHFPGLGRVTANTDTSTKAVDSKTGTDDPDLTPFRAGISSGAGAVMVSSATYRKIDPDHLAVFSPAVITDLLRKKMGYQGVVITDDLGKAVAVTSVPAGQRAVRFIEAGGDIVLSVPAEPAGAMVAAIIARSAQNPTFRARVNAATLRVLQLKERTGLLHCS